MSVYDRLGVRRVINGRSYSTKVGGCLMAPEVLQAMQDAARSFVRIEDLQESASRVIADATGAESGMVTSGAAAALTLAAAACIAGLNASKMNALPDTSGLANEIIVQRLHRNDYDRALRVAGAKIVDVGYNYITFPYELENAVTDRTAAVFFLAGTGDRGLPLKTVADTAHKRNIPVIVDAAAELPPRENLKNFIAQGADLVAFSGGKHIQGPQSTGILCGRKDLILSAGFQQQDMDVFPETWPYRHLVAQGVIEGPPHHGLGRGYKAAKEEIVGLLTALQLYQKRDLEAEVEAWKARVQAIVKGLEGVKGIEATYVFPSHGGRPVPEAHIRLDESRLGMTAWEVINQLQNGDPIIAVYESFASSGLLIVLPESLRDDEPDIIVRRVKEVLSGP
ncbi:MAG TPA: aminotransferase class V-fold PLP-dependent enzyme [Terriglobia bacterium]|nr:aminotransferase class V-fold PLP-dependent enzyme [Terriglobia bacterium]